MLELGQKNAGKTNSTLDEQCINAIRFLSADGVQKANSGHPGAPMGAAAFVFTLWDRFLKHNPQDPQWINRDRFVLSPGHASMLLYSMLHLTGYDLSLDEIKNFRQWGSRTPGHPEYGHTPGVETTTGPLGQGFANAVGMAIAERWLAANYNKAGHEIIDHYTYMAASDGDMQEGISGEAASLAGTLKLGKLICLYDDNGIQIEGSTRTNFTEDLGKRFEAYGWQVLGPVEGNCVDEVADAIETARKDLSKPSLIICKTIIGYGSPMENTEKVHGSPLGEENLKAAKEKLGWPSDKKFHIPDEVKSYMKMSLDRGKKAQEDWDKRFKAYAETFKEPALQFKNQINGILPAQWNKDLEDLFSDSPTMATREASGMVLNKIAKIIPSVFGGSADLAPSNNSWLKDYECFSGDNYGGRNIHFGVREHAMASIANGMAVHGGVIPYCATFLTFSDYMKPAIRLAAMMKQRVIYIFTHDSIGLGEDGPTHQPIEHLMSLRVIPGLTVIRPADALETKEAWKMALNNNNGPTAIILTRQKVPGLDRNTCMPAENLHRGAYILWQSGDDMPQLIIMGTGSETRLALNAGQKLAEEGIKVRVVNIPCWNVFLEQSVEYREKVIPREVTARISVEAGLCQGWEKFTGLKGISIGMTGFGSSAPAGLLYEKFGITLDNIMKSARALLS